MNTRFVVIILMLVLAKIILAQETPTLVNKDSASMAVTAKSETLRPARRWGDGGAGIGLDYGGLIGVRASFHPIKYMGVFGAVGWEIIGIGWNVGIVGRFVPADGIHGFRPYLKVMYGVNGMTKVEGKSGYDEMYYGITAGAGIEMRFGKRKKSGLNLDINVPFRSPDFFEMIGKMEDDPQIEMKNKPWVITMSIGYIVEF